MKDKDAPSIMVKLTSFLFFIFFTVACYLWFIVSSYDTFNSLFSEKLVVDFSKGAMYALGAGIASLLIVFIAAYQSIKKCELSKKQEGIVVKALILSIILMFVFPIIAHFSVNKMTVAKGYYECEEMSYQWLLYRKIVYVKNDVVCSNLIRDK
ncbi:hypothetical protein MNBD_GAMMA17-2279 [hydrothermal vent metagenome]|uniref:DUF1240 domain-containing protein n=1 Tax=hydrothermal vent metagenome TaxID=652676 RepID=A0A3B0ZC35_9ZZZZ